MELPKSKWEFLVVGSKFMIRLPLLYLSYLRSEPAGVFPLSIDINVTDKCNFQCKHCRGIGENRELKQEIDIVVMKKIIDEMKQMHIPYLTLGGGEPLLRYDFVLETIEYATSLHLGVGIVTNGWLLDEDRLLELAGAGLHRIAFSLDGATREVHDEIRMPGSFDQIMSWLSYCQQVKREGRFHFRTHINTVVMKQNFKEAVKIAAIGKKFDATVFYQPVGIPQVYPLEDPSLNPTLGVESFILAGEEIDELELQVRKLIDFKKRYGTIGNMICQLTDIVDYYKSLESGKSLSKFGCYAGFNTIHIESDGDFGSCIFMPYVSNVQNIGLRQAWLSRGYGNQRRLIKNCTRPCGLNCYYPSPIFPTHLLYNFLYLPVRQWGYSLLERIRGESGDT